MSSNITTQSGFTGMVRMWSGHCTTLSLRTYPNFWSMNTNKMEAKTWNYRDASLKEKKEENEDDESVVTDRRDVLLYTIGQLSRQLSYINNAQDESDRLIEKGQRLKAFSKLLDETEQLLKDAIAEVLDMFKLCLPTKNLVPIDIGTIRGLSLNLKELKRIIKIQKVIPQVQKEYTSIQKNLQMAERDLRYLDIQWSVPNIKSV